MTGSTVLTILNTLDSSKSFHVFGLSLELIPHQLKFIKPELLLVALVKEESLFCVTFLDIHTVGCDQIYLKIKIMLSIYEVLGSVSSTKQTDISK